MTSRLRLHPSPSLFTLAALAVLTAGAVWLRPQAAPLPQDDASRAGTPGTAAMRATISPEGVLSVASGRFDLPLDPATAQAVRRDDTGLVPVHHPDGSVSIDLQGRFQSVSIARIGDDGPIVSCADGDHAEHLLNCPAAPGGETPEVK